MGASFSALFIDQDGVSSSSPCLGDLPESCVASIIQHLDPPEICKLAKLNRAFSAASWADFVWESKLPPNYHILVHKILGFVPQNLGKRDIYTRLCRPNTFDGGTKVRFSVLFFVFSPLGVYREKKLDLVSWIYCIGWWFLAQHSRLENLVGFAESMAA